MKTTTLIRPLIILSLFYASFLNVRAQNSTATRARQGLSAVKPTTDNLFFEEQTNNSHYLNASQVCHDTVISVPQNALYFCLGGTCDSVFKLYFEISGSHSAGATIDSSVLWLMTDDRDGAGPLSSLPDSMVPGHDLRNSTNRARWIGGSTPQYIQNSQMNWITPFSFMYFLPDFWSDSGRAVCFTPLAFDSVAAGHFYELDSCQAHGQPIQKIVLKAIYTNHFFSCDSNGNNLHLITMGGLPQYNHYNGYGNTTMYTVVVNSHNYTSHWGDTLVIPAADVNIISITDSLSGSGIADGCVLDQDTIKLYPAINITGLTGSYYDNSPNDTFNVSPHPLGAMRIDFLVSDPASDGIYLLNAHGDTVFSKYPLGSSVGTGNIADSARSLFIYDIPMHGGPFRIVATNDAGSGWRDSTCFSLLHNGHLRVYDLATNTPLSNILFPIGDGNCGATFVVDTFGVFTVTQYNKTQITTNSTGNLTAVDSLGNVIFSPSTSSVGTYQITFTYNDRMSHLCDKDTVINVTINSSVGISDLLNERNVMINNPVHDQLYIKQNNIKSDRLDLIDATGKIILVRKISKEQSIDVSSLAAGLYFIKLFDADNSLVVVKKIIKN